MRTKNLIRAIAIIMILMLSLSCTDEALTLEETLEISMSAPKVENLTQQEIHSNKLTLIEEPQLYKNSSIPVNIQKVIRRRGVTVIFLSLLTLFLFSLTMWLIFLWKYRTAKYNLDRIKAQESINNLEKQLEKHKSDIRQEKEEIINIGRDPLRLLGKFCEEFIVNDTSDKERAVENLRELLHIILEEGHNCFESYINSIYNNILTKLRKDLPDLNETDYKMVGFLFAGLDAATIAVIMRMPSKNAVYIHKSRIKNQIKNIESPYKEYYLTLLC